MRYCYSIFITLVFSCALFAKEPPNLTLLKQKIIRYHDSGQYLRDITAQVHQAKQYLKYRIKHNKNNRKLAVMFDVDDTMLTSYRMMKKQDFSSTLPNIKQKWLQVHSPIKPVLNLYRYAQKHHVATFLTTGRPKSYKKVTIKNLKLAGYSHWTQLIFITSNHIVKNATMIKTNIRKRLMQQGYEIILNIGDQLSDLKGGYATHQIKLPNPFYFVN